MAIITRGGIGMGLVQNLVCAVAVGVASPAMAHVVISQIYGAGGNSGASWNADYVELFNPGDTPVTLTGWSVQYASTTGTTWSRANLTGTIQPYSYFLVRMSTAGVNGSALPTPDFIASPVVSMAETAGKVALVSNQTALSGGQFQPLPGASGILDFVGYGTAAGCYEGAGTTPAPSTSNAIFRINGGCTDNNSNLGNFIAAAAAPRNSSSPAAPCSPAEVTGACCGVNIACRQLTESDCLALGGSYQGDFTACTPGTYTSTNNAAALDDISTQGATIIVSATGGPIDNLNSPPIPIPFTFHYYGQPKTQVIVNTNGWMAFANPSNAVTPGNQSFPGLGTPHDMMSPYWDDLLIPAIPNTGSDATIIYLTKGVAPNRQFIVQWDKIRQRVSTTVAGNTPNTFQVILNELDDSIEFRYGSIAAQGTNVGITVSYTAGVESVGSLLGHDVTAAMGNITGGPSAARQFFPNDQCPETGSCCLGNVCTITTEINCLGSGGSFGGTGTTCSPDPCAMGACCFDMQACQQLTSDACLNAGGTYLGDNADCIDCASLGACCLPGFVCQELTESDCINAGGSWLLGGSCSVDSDGDGVADVCDGCPNDPAKTSPDVCGCGVVDVPTVYFADADGDGYGNPNDTFSSYTCLPPPVGFVADNTDCNDTDPNVNPGAPELCNNLDDNCNNTVDEGLPTFIYYIDADGDGFGVDDSNTNLVTCLGNVPAGYSSVAGDCDDGNAAAYPGAAEVCDGIDNNCDGLVDDDDPSITGQTTWYEDADGDGYGNPNVSVLACTAPVGPPTYVADNTDCNDGNPNINPGAPEICNGIDDNCNGQSDENNVCTPLLVLTNSMGSDCLQPGESFTVSLSMLNLGSFQAAGFQAFLQFDPTKISFTGGSYTPAPFGLPIIMPIAATPTGQIDVASGIDQLNNQLPTSLDSVLVTLNFTVLGIDDCNFVPVAFRNHNRPARITNTSGQAISNLMMVDALAIVIDGTDPEIVCPSDETVECPDSTDPSSTGTATATDNCGVVMVTYADSIATGNCVSEFTITRTWTATDCAGNTSTCEQVIEVVDTTVPDITSPATHLTVECDGAGNAAQLNAWLASNGGAVASDSCSSVAWSHDFTSLSNACGATGSATVTFTATDECGNQSNTVATFTIEDTTNPVISTPASNLMVECDGGGNAGDLNAWLASNGGAMAADVCSGVTWSHDFTGLSASCGATGMATVTFTATDACGNFSTTTATFTIVDTLIPDITMPAANLTVECDGAGNAAQLNAWLASNGGAIANDACSGVTWSNNFNGLSSACGATGSATVIFTATDACNNSSQTSATFTIQDTTDPNISSPAVSQTVQCDGAGNTAQLNAWLASNGSAVAADVCSGVTWTHNFTALSDLCGETGAATVTFTATDACGNFSTTMATFTISDTLPPTFGVACPMLPINVNADAGGCTASAATVGLVPPAASDTCSGVATVVGTRSDAMPLGDPYPAGTTTITWTATDVCGNAAICLQDVIVSAFNEVLMDVQLSPTVVNSLSRCITFEFFNCNSGIPVVVHQQIAFTNGLASGVSVLVPCADGPYTCVTARDRLHTLRRTSPIAVSGVTYVSSFTGVKSLTGGNLNDDQHIDILDFGTFAGQYNTNLPPSTCATIAPHSDIDGNGVVFTGDFTFIQINFLDQADPICCAPPLTALAIGHAADNAAQAGNGPVTRISVADLWAIGHGQLTAADLNNDGWLDQLDIAAFMTGAQPMRLNVFGSGAGGADGNWFNQSSWGNALLPDDQTNVVIPNQSRATIDRSNAIARNITVMAGGTIRLIGNGALAAQSLTIAAGATLQIEGLGALLQLRSLSLEAGATLVWNGGTIEVDGGTYQIADDDLLVGETPLLSTLRFINGASGVVIQNTIIGVHSGDQGRIQIADSTLVTQSLHVGFQGVGTMEIIQSGWVDCVSVTIGALPGSFGQLTIADGALLQASQRIMVGQNDVEGSLHLQTGGTASAPEISIGNLGVIDGQGTLTGLIHNFGVFAPQLIHVQGDFVQDALGVIDLKLENPLVSNLSVNGDVVLGGALHVTLTQRYVPEIGQRFDLIVGRAVLHQFASVHLPQLGHGLRFDVVYETDRVSLIVVRDE